MTFADVNGDGELEVVVGTYNGRVYVLHGATGTDVAPFPFQVEGGRGQREPACVAAVVVVVVDGGLAVFCPVVSLLCVRAQFCMFVRCVRGTPLRRCGALPVGPAGGG